MAGGSRACARRLSSANRRMAEIVASGPVAPYLESWPPVKDR